MEYWCWKIVDLATLTEDGGGIDENPLDGKVWHLWLAWYEMEGKINSVQ